MSDEGMDRLFMRRALELAMIGRGRVSPNPLVGAVVVYQGRVIGEGWHQEYGHDHAEVNAINSVEDKGLLAQSTLYVNLEPCSHFGKTPPCADMVVRSKIPRVVVCNMDPHPMVAGQGIEKLRQADVSVTTGILEQEGRYLNRFFFTSHEKGRPHIILKWAETSDGFIAGPPGTERWISDSYSRQLAHRLRAETDAIMIGAGTARADDPSLDTRDWMGKDPLRVVISHRPMEERKLKILSDGKPTLNYHCGTPAPNINNVGQVQCSEANMLTDVVKNLWERNVLSVLVEGGTQLIDQFIENEMFDEIIVFQSLLKFKEGIESPRFNPRTCSWHEGHDDRIFFA